VRNIQRRVELFGGPDAKTQAGLSESLNSTLDSKLISDRKKRGGRGGVKEIRPPFHCSSPCETILPAVVPRVASALVRRGTAHRYNQSNFCLANLPVARETRRRESGGS
jgi:hypothetical protein